MPRLFKLLEFQMIIKGDGGPSTGVLFNNCPCFGGSPKRDTPFKESLKIKGFYQWASAYTKGHMTDFLDHKKYFSKPLFMNP